MSTTIQPNAMILKNDVLFKGFTVDFPEEWRQLIISLELKICDKKKSDNNEKVNIKSENLNRLIASQIPDIACIKALNSNKAVLEWVISLKEIDCVKLCDIVRSWLSVRYKTAITSEQIDSITPDKLFISCREFSFSMNDDINVIKKYAFSVIPKYIANRMMKSPIIMDGSPLEFFLSGEHTDKSGKTLISKPIFKNGKWFSITIRITLQTLPPNEQFVVYFKTCTKRYVSKGSEKSKPIYHADNINAIVMTDNSCFVIPVIGGWNKEKEKKIWVDNWDKEAKECYDVYFMNTLPDSVETLTVPEKFIKEDSNPRILLPFREGMEGNKLKGTGISASNRKDIFSTALESCSDIAKSADPIVADKFVCAYNAEKAGEKATSKEDAEGLIIAERLKRLALCTGQNHITFELYGTEDNMNLIKRTECVIRKILGNTDFFKVEILIADKKETGEITALLTDDTEDSFKERVIKIGEMLSSSLDIRGAFIILPNYKESKEQGDPQKAIRIGMALLNRLTQFVTPDTEEYLKKLEEDKEEFAKEKPNQEFKEGKVYGAVLDMLRQFSFTDYIGSNKCVDALQNTTVIGLYLHKIRYRFLSGKNNIRQVPVILTYNLKTGKINVQSDLIKELCLFEDEISYSQALIYFAQASWNGLLKNYSYENRRACHNGIMDNLERLLLEFFNEPVLITTHTNDGSLRNEWIGLQNGVISKYRYTEPYVPDKIEFGTAKFSKMKSFKGTGVRIVSCRTNSCGETPDWYSIKEETDSKVQFGSASGIFKFFDVFMCLETRGGGSEYRNAINKSRILNPSMCFDTCNLVEMFPLQLQPGDDPLDWVRFNNALRMVIPENQSHKMTRLPAPLHFARLMDEYLLTK